MAVIGFAPCWRPESGRDGSRPVEGDMEVDWRCRRTKPLRPCHSFVGASTRLIRGTWFVKGLWSSCVRCLSLRVVSVLRRVS